MDGLGTRIWSLSVRTTNLRSMDLITVLGDCFPPCAAVGDTGVSALAQTALQMAQGWDRGRVLGLGHGAQWVG